MGRGSKAERKEYAEMEPKRREARWKEGKGDKLEAKHEGINT